MKHLERILGSTERNLSLMEPIYEETDVKVTEEVESCCTLVALTSSKKKRRTKGTTEHAEKPKKPRSAYLLYYFDVHQRLQQENPDMPQSEINKRISDSWKRLNVADKGYYLERAKMEKDGVDPTTQSSASQDVPGFRRILPRTDYVLLSKTSVAEERTGTSMDLCMDGDSPLALGSEVELVEQCVTMEPLADDTVLSRSGALQGMVPQCSTSTGRLLTFPQHSHQSTSLVVKEDGGGASGRAFGRAYDMEVEEGFEGVTAISQVKADATHLVAIIPSNELVENKVLPAVSPVVMLPLVNQAKPEPKPSFKLSIKYTRRGRGYCSTPGCSFTYVTRHKPPRCPDCGQHLGGKWVPSAAKKAGAGSSSSPQKLKGQVDGSRSMAVSSKVAIQSTVKPSDTVTGQTQAPKSKKSDKTVLHPKVKTDVSALTNAPGSWRREKMGVVTVYQPAGGDKDLESIQLSGSTTVIGLSGGCVRVISKETGQKRRIRAILPAPATPSISSQPAVVQWIAVPPSKINGDTKITTRTVKPQNERILSLKPSTLKQLGHSVPPSALEQKPLAVNSSQYVVTERGVKILSMVPLKKNSSSSLALGLSTARGRGRCKNPSCNYVYKNRHKPQYCPICGCELATKATKKAKASSLEPADMSTRLLDPSQPFTPGQRELQRQSTVTLLKHSLQFPENEAELQDILTHIHNLNQAHSKTDKEDSEKDEETDGVTEEHCGSPQDGWPSSYEPTATHCSLCNCPLYRGGESCSIAGQQQCWLVTQVLLKPVSLQLKTCLNSQCLALHSFTSLYPGLFNVGNQLLVSLDLFFKIRSQIKQGQDPSLAALDIINNTHCPPGCVLSPDEHTRVQELLCSGYWAFECLTVRDFNDMICGICGIAPKLEIAQRNTNVVLQLKNVEFTWPEFQASDEVQVEEFWLAMESEALEQAIFPSSVSITRFDASIIAPFFPALMRSSVVINTEKDKITTNMEHTGDLSMLIRLIHDGHLRPEQMEQHTEEELRSILEQCGVPPVPHSTKDELMVSVCLLYTQVQNGLSTAPEPAEHLTAGKLSKVCPHQVVCGSKYLVRGESARDHVDLLVSTRFWPPVYIAECAQKVALCAEALYPELASQMWGRNQGCFSDPTSPVEYVSCPELQDQQYSMDLSSVDSNSHVHPYTKSSSRYILHPGDPSLSSSSSSSSYPHRALTLCKELQSYSNLVASMSNSLEENEKKSGEKAKQRTLVFNNAAHYYLYNRLVDFLSSRDVVSQQMAEVLRVCQQGEVVMIRDALYRLGVAQLNREDEEREHMGEEEEAEAEGDADAVAVDDVVLE
ncbi:HMG domain-containing protein 3 [Clarias gariepinus]|uniref:HMG domain-containing protein 3 n=1 Tax=Clarias gariepinus TaxID=13013 RepID=UPI00234C5EFB|nr:HMG domain-containing protein 3 [Clarias gariepinus]